MTRHALALAAIGALAGPLPAQAVTYLRTDLGQLHGSAIAARALNNRAQVVGKRVPPSPAYQQALRYDPVLGQIEANTLATVGSSAAAINDLGHGAGRASTVNLHAMLCKHVVGFQERAPSNTAASSDLAWPGLALNNRDQVAGLS